MASRAAVAVLALSLLSVPLAQAQKPSAAQRKAAKAHFDQGRAYYDAGAYDDAIREYEKAHAIVPLPDLVFNVAQALRLKGDKPKAIEAYQRYLDRVPEGPLAEEARNHIAALRLRIQVEEAEAARKKAAEEADAARKKAAEESAARQRLEAEAAARARGHRDDEERLRRVAAEEAERARRQREDDATAAKRRLDEAAGAGRGLRISGIVFFLLGVTALATGIAGPYISEGQTINDLKQFNNDQSRAWDGTLDRSVSRLHAAQKQGMIVAGVGGAVTLGGAALYYFGVRARSKEVAKVRAAAALQRGGGVVALEGRF